MDETGTRRGDETVPVPNDITVEDNRFRGSEVPVAFVGVDGAVFRRNVIYEPEKWVLRILQESTGERFVRM